MALENETLCTLTDFGDNSVLLPSVRVTVSLPQGDTIDAPLGMNPLTVGTSPECDLVVADARVSRRHCELRLTRRGIILRDLGSKNGTFIGEVPIFEVILPKAITVSIGNSQLSLQMGGAPSVVPLSSSRRFGDAIGTSDTMRALFARIKHAAETTETILLYGESGTGKEVLAKAIHANSPRKDGPFIILDCSAIAPTQIEAELFGYAKGAYTGAQSAHEGLLEQAHGGTLFIDELGELPLDLQPKLLRALEARQVRRMQEKAWRDFDARVIAATNRNLRAQIIAGSFREDLFYRLAVVEVHIPSLRERKEDIPVLTEAFLAARNPPRTIADLPGNAIELLTAHDWPGNVRELRNTVARMVLFPDLGREVFGPSLEAKNKAKEAADMNSTLPVTEPPAAPSRPEPQTPKADGEGLGALLSLPLLEAREMVLEQFERSYLTQKLREHNYNISRAADAMGVSRQLVHRLIDRYNLKSEKAT